MFLDDGTKSSLYTLLKGSDICVEEIRKNFGRWNLLPRQLLLLQPSLDASQTQLPGD